jgi:Domain of unknown function (DUF5664)
MTRCKHGPIWTGFRCFLCDAEENPSAKHMDDGKPGIHCILAMPLITEMAKVMDYGAKKYGSHWNYRKGMNWMKLLGSCSRHLAAFIRGENNDKETGLSHLAHLACDAAMLYEHIGHFDNLDDRPRPC